MSLVKLRIKLGFILASYPGFQKAEENAWYTLFAHSLNLLLGSCIMDVSDVGVWAGFC